MTRVDDDKKDYSSYEDENEEHYELEYEDETDDESDLAINEMAVLGTYQGQRNSNNERHGYGKTLLPNGDAYVGTYKNGKRHGRGQYKFKNGAVYRGCYKEGLRNGKGVMNYPDNSKYDGYWIDNKKDGDGVYTYANHDVFSGSWKSDMKHGVGSYTFCKTGAIMKGSWLNDNRVNNFQVYFPTGAESGFTFHGTWDDNETVAGEGYFVFEDAKCMLSGVHMENPLHVKNTTSKQNVIDRKTTWIADKILPIVNTMLPSLPKKRPMTIKRSSCDVDFLVPAPTSDVPSNSTSREEMYDNTDDFWTRAGEFSELEAEQIEDESKSSDYRQQDENI